jgi:NAD(P)-dependent dehydrogenase (short-subunit alcohol dehydrogenase family)
MKNRRVLVTGAGGCLGKTITITAAELGADLILIDHPNTDLTPLAHQVETDWGVKAEAFACDLECERSRENLINDVNSRFTSLHSLVNNAAFVGSAGLTGWAVPMEEQSLTTWRRALEVNLTACFHLSQGLASKLKISTGSNIVNIGSIYGTQAPDWRLYDSTTMGNPAAYAASKGGLLQLTRWLATTLAPSVRVNAISPGGIFRNQPDVFVKKYQERTPLGRMANEHDFRGAITFLISDMSSYVTGHVLNVDGGWSIW